MARKLELGRRGVEGASFLAERFNPLTNDPSAPLKTVALFDSFGPSLMPRASMHQGVSAAVSILAAEAVGKGFDAAIRKFVPGSSPYVVRMGARAVLTAAGYALTKIPQSREESTVVASARTGGRLAMAGGFGGMVYESATELKHRYPATGPARPIVITLGGVAGALLYSEKLLETRKEIIKRWSADDAPASLPAALGIGLGAATASGSVDRKGVHRISSGIYGLLRQRSREEAHRPGGECSLVGRGSCCPVFGWCRLHRQGKRKDRTGV